MVTGGSIAVKSPDMFLSWIVRFGKEKIILGADVKDEKLPFQVGKKILKLISIHL